MKTVLLYCVVAALIVAMYCWIWFCVRIIDPAVRRLITRSVAKLQHEDA